MHAHTYSFTFCCPPSLKVIISESSQYKRTVFSYNGGKKRRQHIHIGFLLTMRFAKINPGTLLLITQYPDTAH